MIDCPWCGLPMETASHWTSKDVPMATAKCLNGHWYGGPADVLEER